MYSPRWILNKVNARHSLSPLPLTWLTVMWSAYFRMGALVLVLVLVLVLLLLPFTLPPCSPCCAPNLHCAQRQRITVKSWIR